jgi:hypothetical protein
LPKPPKSNETSERGYTRYYPLTPRDLRNMFLVDTESGPIHVDYRRVIDVPRHCLRHVHLERRMETSGIHFRALAPRSANFKDAELVKAWRFLVSFRSHLGYWSRVIRILIPDRLDFARRFLKLFAAVISTLFTGFKTAILPIWKTRIEHGLPTFFRYKFALAQPDERLHQIVSILNTRLFIPFTAHVNKKQLKYTTLQDSETRRNEYT